MSQRHTRVTELPAICTSASDGGRAARQTLDRVGDKWSVLLIATLGAGSVRFTTLAQQIPGISQRMLTLTLRHLERDGLLTRTAYAEVPPRVEYALTPLGESLREIVLGLATWANDHNDEIEAARQAFDARVG
jgi:DNA-binding HxlR family transcriptional regulator